MVVRNDQIDLAGVRELQPAAIVMSPGPCAPDRAGICLEVVEGLHRTVPMLGVCLGHQAICQALGGAIGRATPVHGRATPTRHFGHPLFDGIPSPFAAGRYHSLVALPESVPRELEVIAITETSETGESDCEVMAVAHRRLPVIGVQFHPESILTTGGYRLLANFLRLAGIGDCFRC